MTKHEDKEHRKTLEHEASRSINHKATNIYNLSITCDYLVPSLSFNVSISSGNSNLNLEFVTSNFELGFRQFDNTAAQSLRFLQNMILRKEIVD